MGVISCETGNQSHGTMLVFLMTCIYMQNCHEVQHLSHSHWFTVQQEMPWK